MNIKTSLAIMSVVASPINVGAQKTAKAFKPQVIEQIVNDTTSKMISYKDFIYPDSYYNAGKNLTKIVNNKGWAKPTNFKKPNLDMAGKKVVNADKTVYAYDKFGNVSEIYSKQGNKTRTITRDSSGNLCEYSNISYKNGRKSVEDIYNEQGLLVETHKYHGNGTATVRNFDDNGNVQFEALYKTENHDGEEFVPGGCGYFFE